MSTDYDAIQLYVGHRDYGIVEPPTPPEDDKMDFADIGGTYNSQAAGAENVTALNNYLADVDSPVLTFGGVPNASYNNKRVPAIAFFNGTINIPADKPVWIDGANGRLTWDTITGTTPAISMGSGSGSVRRVLQNFDINVSGSGIRLQSPGKGTVLRDIRFSDPVDLWGGQSTGNGVVSLDDMTDLETAAYAYKIEDSDGFSLLDCSCIRPGDHGIIVTRLHDGVMRSRVWGAVAGSGIKGQGINGGQTDVVAESCYGYGYDLSHCGVPVVQNNVAVNISHSKPGVADFWVENNSYRNNPSLGGIKVRQGKLRHCGSQFIGGSNAWGSNKVDLDEGTRNSCVLIHDVHVSQSVAPMYDLENEDETAPTFTLPDQTADALNNNFDAVWGGAQPTVTTLGTQGNLSFLISFPPNSLSAITGATAYWRPWGLLTGFAPQDGDRYIYEMELVGSAGAYGWCNQNDHVNSTIVVTSIAPYGGPGGANWVGLYNGMPRKILGRISLEAGNTGIPTPAFTWDPGLPNNTEAFTLTVTSLKFYGIRQNGGSV